MIFINHPILFFYFLVVVGFVGSSGVWIPFILDYHSKGFDATGTFTVGVATYCIALLAAAMADNLLSPEKVKTVRFFIFCLFLLSFLLAYITIIDKKIWVAILATFVTFFMWILNYSEDEAKKDEKAHNPEAGTGGSTETPLQGNTEGFES
jgi:Ca2+/Na+ antiporter